MEYHYDHPRLHISSYLFSSLIMSLVHCLLYLLVHIEYYPQSQDTKRTEYSLRHSKKMYQNLDLFMGNYLYLSNTDDL